MDRQKHLCSTAMRSSLPNHCRLCHLRLCLLQGRLRLLHDSKCSMHPQQDPEGWSFSGGMKMGSTPQLMCQWTKPPPDSKEVAALASRHQARASHMPGIRDGQGRAGSMSGMNRCEMYLTRSLIWHLGAHALSSPLEFGSIDTIWLS